ncbi:MAG: hypothetical protein IJL51_08660 [Oscillospiraceae bacterium]|nr:hypothetical protein [Oscillospiraceae bacterium]
MKLEAILKKLDQIKIPLLILAVGLLLLLMPSGGRKDPENDSNSDLQSILSSARGIGQAQVLISENGVVIVCDGADDASVKLDILRAVGSYTGFGSDKITILKRMEH